MRVRAFAQPSRELPHARSQQRPSRAAVSRDLSRCHVVRELSAVSQRPHARRTSPRASSCCRASASRRRYSRTSRTVAGSIGPIARRDHERSRVRSRLSVAHRERRSRQRLRRYDWNWSFIGARRASARPAPAGGEPPRARWHSADRSPGRRDIRASPRCSAGPARRARRERSARGCQTGRAPAPLQTQLARAACRLGPSRIAPRFSAASALGSASAESRNCSSASAVRPWSSRKCP